MKLLISVFIVILSLTPKQNSNTSENSSTSKKSSKRWVLFLKKFRKNRKKTIEKLKKQGDRRFPITEKRAWRDLLKKFYRIAPKLSKRELWMTRELLELEGDRARNYYSDFPESLSRELIRGIVYCDILRGFYKKRAGFISIVGGKREGSHKKPGNKYALGNEGEIPPEALKYRAPQKSIDLTRRLQEIVSESRREKGVKVYGYSPPPLRGLIWPIRSGRLASGFGWRIDPFTGKRRFHAGLDIVAGFGTPVFSTADGKVVRSGWSRRCGLGVLIRHSGGLFSYYCHLSQILAPLHKRIKKGEIIGKIGSTGRSTSPHLHFGLIYRGRPIDPLPLLP